MTIQGAVTVDGSAALGVTVALSAGPSGGTTTTEASGGYLFSNVSEGEHAVTISRFPPDVDFPSTTRLVSVTHAHPTGVANFAGTRRPSTPQLSTRGGVLQIDPGRHAGDRSHDPEVFNAAGRVGATVVATVDGSAITIEGTTGFAPSDLPVLSGTIDDRGRFTVSGSGTIAGLDDVVVTATGSLHSRFSMTIRVGVNGGLPGGEPIQYIFMTN